MVPFLVLMHLLFIKFYLGLLFGDANAQLFKLCFTRVHYLQQSSGLPRSKTNFLEFCGRHEHCNDQNEYDENINVYV